MSGELAKAARAYRAYSEALYPALADDPFYVALEQAVPDSDKSKEAMLCYYDYSIYEAANYGQIYKPEETPFGISVWSVPLEAETAAEKARHKNEFIKNIMGERCLQTYNEINAFMSAASKPITAETDWYLSILGLLPAYQSRGLGGRLIRPVLEQADAAGVATFLETFTPRNMSFYKRLGYEAVATFREPTTQSDYWLMRRLPG